MAVCELEEPFRVTKARTFDGSRWMVSLGVRSSARMMTASALSRHFSDVPVSFRMTLLETSNTSIDLAFMYSSSISAKVPEKSSAVTKTEYSAVSFSFLIKRSMLSR